MTRRMYQAMAVLLVLAVALLAAKSCADGHGAQPKIPPPVRRDLDSLAMTRPAHEAEQDSLRARAQRETDARVLAQHRADALATSARTIQHRADSLAALAQTAEQWHAAHDARQQEAESWHRTADERDVALQHEIVAHARADSGWTAERARRIHLETVTVPGLERAIAKLEQPCRVAFIPCPPRAVVGVIGAVGGYVLGNVLPAPRLNLSSNRPQFVP